MNATFTREEQIKKYKVYIMLYTSFQLDISKFIHFLVSLSFEYENTLLGKAIDAESSTI